MADTKDKKVCFVITPIGDNNSDIRRHIDGIIEQAIEPALGEKYEIVAAHKKYEIGSINDRVIKSVLEADLVVANLTDTNPNVMYELAIRHSFGKPAIVLIHQNGTIKGNAFFLKLILFKFKQNYRGDDVWQILDVVIFHYGTVRQSRKLLIVCSK